MLGGVAVGSWLRHRLPEHHLTDQATGIIKSGVGLISTLAALILGLLISTAKISYDSTATQVNQITSDLVLLDQLLATYGPAAHEAREPAAPTFSLTSDARCGVMPKCYHNLAG
jgi:hypothetical protein